MVHLGNQVCRKVSSTGMKKWIPILLLLILALCVSQVRDWLMYNFNYQIDHVTRSTDQSFAHSLFKTVTSDWSLQKLTISKWICSILVIVVMLGITLMVAKQLFGDHRYATMLAIAYLIAASLALTFHSLGGSNENFRLAGVQLLHALQYPVVLFVLILASPIAKQSPQAE